MWDYVFIRATRCYERVNFADILYLEASRNYTKIHLRERYLITMVPMYQFVKLLPREKFCRVHRAYIVSLDKVTSFDFRQVFLSDIILPIGETYRSELEKGLNVIVTPYRERSPRKGKVSGGSHSDAV